jgi:hypothetical protein
MYDAPARSSSAPLVPFLTIMRRRSLAGLVTTVLLAAAIGAAVATGTTGARISDADAQQLNGTAVRGLEEWRAAHGSYAGATLARLASHVATLQDAAGLGVSHVTATGYRVMTHSSPGRTFRTTRRGTAPVRRTCAPAGAGKCSDDGTWTAPAR